jgi:hypothetical protein
MNNVELHFTIKDSISLKKDRSRQILTGSHNVIVSKHRDDDVMKLNSTNTMPKQRYPLLPKVQGPVEDGEENIVAPEGVTNAIRNRKILESSVRIRRSVKIPVEDSWNKTTSCEDRDVLIQIQDNFISKSRDAKIKNISPKFVSVSSLSDYHRKSLPAKSPRLRPPTKTSGPIVNISIVKKDLQRSYNIESIHPSDIPGFEGHKFGTILNEESKVARPHTSSLDKTSEGMRKLFRRTYSLPDTLMVTRNIADIVDITNNIS